MHIKTARKLAMACMIVSVICALFGLVFVEPGTILSVYVTFGAFGLMVVAMILIFGVCRCPWCGKRITSGLMKAEYCPHCKKDFDTGLKYKKGKRK